MMKKLMHRSYEVGRLLNSNLGVYRVAAHGQKYDCFPGGRGIVEMSLELIQRTRHPLTLGELSKLDASLKTQGALILVNR